MLNTVVDIVESNPILKVQLINAVGAICGMVDLSPGWEIEFDKPVVNDEDVDNLVVQIEGTNDGSEAKISYIKLKFTAEEDYDHLSGYGPACDQTKGKNTGTWSFDAETNSITLEVSEQELQQRKQEWKAYSRILI